QEKMGQALARLATEDPSFRVAVDHESGQTIIKGMGELHLEIIVDRMRREFKVDANVGAPQVAYRETITRTSEVDYTHKKQTGGAGQFARVKLRFEPLPPGSGFAFENAVVGGTVPKEYVPGVEKGLKASTETGVDTRGNARVIDAMVPLANMFGYVNTLRSMSQGRAQYTMHFDHYEQVPQAVADEVRAKMA